MIRRQAIQRLVYGVQNDVADYRALRLLLQAQFDAALRHRTAELADVAADISALCEVLQVRRRERLELLEVCVGEGAPADAMMAVLSKLPAVYGAAALALWQTLQDLVRECKAFNQRNCALLMDQHALMQRVLNQESDIYAPL